MVNNVVDNSGECDIVVEGTRIRCSILQFWWCQGSTWPSLGSPNWGGLQVGGTMHVGSKGGLACEPGPSQIPPNPTILRSRASFSSSATSFPTIWRVNSYSQMPGTHLVVPWPYYETHLHLQLLFCLLPAGDAPSFTLQLSTDQ
jgi:hypothetical protein